MLQLKGKATNKQTHLPAPNPTTTKPPKHLYEFQKSVLWSYKEETEKAGTNIFLAQQIVHMQLFVHLFLQKSRNSNLFLAWNKLKILQCRLAAQTFGKDTIKFERIYQKIPLSPRHNLPFGESFLKLVVLLNLPWDVLESRWITLHICITRVSLLAPLKRLLQRDIGQDACSATFRRR